MTATAMPLTTHRVPCVHDPDLFEPRRRAEPLADLRARRARAIRLCRGCPALDACREHAPRVGGFVVAGRVVLGGRTVA